MFVLCKDGRKIFQLNQICRTSDNRICVWQNESSAIIYAESLKHDNWRVRPAETNDFTLAGKAKRNRRDRSRPCYQIMD